jgi:hypothetical protein
MTNDFPIVDGGGDKRVLSCIPSPVKVMATLPQWGVKNTTVSIAEISDYLQKKGHIDLAILKSPVLDQGQTGGCAAWSSVTAFNLAWNLGGQDYKTFSPGFLYAQVNGGQDRGSTPVDNMNALKDIGVCSKEFNPNEVIYKSQVDQRAYTSAQRFKLQASYVINTWEELTSAIFLNRPVEFGMKLPNGYDEGPDQRTGLPGYEGYLGLHGQCGRGLFYHPDIKQVVIIVQNSWSERWGIQGNIYNLGNLKGCCFLTEKHIFSGYFEAYAIVADLPDPQDPNAIPVAK